MASDENRLVEQEAAEDLRVRSPCVSLCKLDSNNRCLGCFRLSDEITYWTTFSNQEKQRIVDQCLLREKELKDRL